MVWNTDQIYRIIIQIIILFISINRRLALIFQIHRPQKKYFEQGRQMAALRLAYASVIPNIIYQVIIEIIISHLIHG